MSVEKTLKAYQQEKLNCAQSILRGFQDTAQVAEENIGAAKAWGGGRAEGGICGALYAAKQLADAETGAQLDEQFQAIAGSTLCRDIRCNGKLSCSGCVELAAKILHKQS